jgi:hypothetical protein
MLKLQGNEEKDVILARDMQDGDMAVVVSTGLAYNPQVGIVVQRIKFSFVSGATTDVLVTLGAGSQHAWEPASKLSDSFKVRLLKPGETFVLE